MALLVVLHSLMESETERTVLRMTLACGRDGARTSRVWLLRRHLHHVTEFARDLLREHRFRSRRGLPLYTQYIVDIPHTLPGETLRTWDNVGDGADLEDTLTWGQDSDSDSSGP